MLFSIVCCVRFRPLIFVCGCYKAFPNGSVVAVELETLTSIS